MFQFQFKFRIFSIIKFENFLEYLKIFRKLFRIILEKIGNFLRNLYKLTILTKIVIIAILIQNLNKIIIFSEIRQFF